MPLPQRPIAAPGERANDRPDWHVWIPRNKPGQCTECGTFRPDGLPPTVHFSGCPHFRIGHGWTDPAQGQSRYANKQQRRRGR